MAIMIGVLFSYVYYMKVGTPSGVQVPDGPADQIEDIRRLKEIKQATPAA